MTTDLDVTRIVRSWLQADEHESAERVLLDVLAAVDTTPQRRSWWPAGRTSEMPGYARIAIAITALVAVSLIGVYLLPGRNGLIVEGPGAATSTPSPTPAPTHSTTLAAFPPAGPLEPGVRHLIELEGVPFTFTVPPSDWVSNGSYAIDKAVGVGPAGAGFILWTDTPVGVFTDPCSEARGPEIGTDIQELAAAVTAVPGLDVVTEPTPVVVGGKPARHVVVTVRDDILCPATQFYLWWAPGADMARYATQQGSTIYSWIIDVDGTTVWIDGETYEGAGAEPADEIRQIVESIRFTDGTSP